MHIVALQENLNNSLQQAVRFIPHKPSLPVLSCFLITAEKNDLQIYSTDLRVGLKMKMSAEVRTPGKVAVPAKTLAEFVAQLIPGKIELILDNDSLLIKTDKTKASIKCFPAVDYPLFPQSEGVEHKIDREKLITSIQSTSFAAGVDETRPVLTSSLFSLKKDSLTCVATDGFRLSHVVVPYNSETEVEVLLPTKALNEVVRICSKAASQTISVTLSDKLKQAFFSFQDMEVVVRIMEGEFPPYQKIFPTEFQTQCIFDGEEFLRCLKASLIFARESSGVIKMEVQKDHLKIVASSSTVGTQEGQIPIELISGGDQEIAFNSRYVVEFLANFKPEKVWFGMNESLRPALMRPENRPDASYLLMPFRVNK